MSGRSQAASFIRWQVVTRATDRTAAATLPARKTGKTDVELEAEQRRLRQREPWRVGKGGGVGRRDRAVDDCVGHSGTQVDCEQSNSTVPAFADEAVIAAAPNARLSLKTYSLPDRRVMMRSQVEDEGDRASGNAGDMVCEHLHHCPLSPWTTPGSPDRGRSPLDRWRQEARPDRVGAKPDQQRPLASAAPRRCPSAPLSRPRAAWRRATPRQRARDRSLIAAYWAPSSASCSGGEHSSTA